MRQDILPVVNWPPLLPQHVGTENDDSMFGDFQGRVLERVKGKVVYSRQRHPRI